MRWRVREEKLWRKGDATNCMVIRKFPAHGVCEKDRETRKRGRRRQGERQREKEKRRERETGESDRRLVRCEPRTRHAPRDEWPGKGGEAAQEVQESSSEERERATVRHSRGGGKEGESRTSTA